MPFFIKKGDKTHHFLLSLSFLHRNKASFCARMENAQNDESDESFQK